MEWYKNTKDFLKMIPPKTSLYKGYDFLHMWKVLWHQNNGENEPLYFFAEKNSPATTFTPHYHFCCEILFVIEGKMKLQINDNVQDLKTGDIAIICTNDIHCYYCNDSTNLYRTMFNPSFFDNKKGFSDEFSFDNAFITAEKVPN